MAKKQTVGAGKVARASAQDVLRGTLDLLILKTLRAQSFHGWAITQRIEQLSGGVLEINQGSLYPALQRLEKRGLIAGEWKVSELKRRARFYSLTASGRKALGEETNSWRQYVLAVEGVLGG